MKFLGYFYVQTTIILYIDDYATLWRQMCCWWSYSCCSTRH